MTPRVRTALAVATTAATLACGDISAPQRTDVYDWRIFASKTAGGGIDTLTFHWPAAALPVRFWVEDSVGMPARVQRALDSWQASFLYGEFRGQIVSDSATADVIVRPIAAPGGGVELGSFFAPECRGATDLDIRNDDLHTLHLPVRVYVDPKFDAVAAGVSDCLDLTTIHEIGHALGIWQHSPQPGDIMYGDPSVSAPSTRDRQTIERIYHNAPNVVTAR